MVVLITNAYNDQCDSSKSSILKRRQFVEKAMVQEYIMPV